MRASHSTESSRTLPSKVEPGTRLGDYEILSCIARGGMATVWAARQHGARGFNRLVAIKTVLSDYSEGELDSMFVEEARIASRVHHPNVCEVFELVEAGGILGLSMEWVDGETLGNVLGGDHGLMDRRVAAHIVAEVARGLHAAHELSDEMGRPLKLVHRDVSPQNVLVSRQGHVKIADFGVAKALGGCCQATAIGQIKGKLNYMSPEQALGEPLDRRSDIFSLGVVLYIATVGHHPFRRRGDDRRRQLERLYRDRIVPPTHVDPGFPIELEDILMRALERHPEDRFPTADQFGASLRRWLEVSGSSLGERDVARVVMERVGERVEERRRKIQQCLDISRQIAGARSSQLSSDSTFQPVHAETQRTGIRRRGSRVPSLALAIGSAAILSGLGLHAVTGASSSPTAAAGATTLPASAPPLARELPVRVDEAARGSVLEASDSVEPAPPPPAASRSSESASELEDPRSTETAAKAARAGRQPLTADQVTGASTRATPHARKPR